MALIFFLKGDYRLAYSLLWISTILAIISLSFARVAFPVPSSLESKTQESKKFNLSYWLYMVAGALFAAGLMSYELVSYHLARQQIVAGHWIPVLLAFATLCAIGASLLLGKLYDNYALKVILFAVLFSALFSPLVFLGDFSLVLLAMPLWGIGYALQDTLLKALVANFLPRGRRGLAFGLFYAVMVVVG